MTIAESVTELRELVWGMDIPSPTCPEYVEHHKDIQNILKFIDEKLAPVIKEAGYEQKV